MEDHLHLFLAYHKDDCSPLKKVTLVPMAVQQDQDAQSGWKKYGENRADLFTWLNFITPKNSNVELIIFKNTEKQYKSNEILLRYFYTPYVFVTILCFFFAFCVWQTDEKVILFI